MKNLSVYCTTCIRLQEGASRSNVTINMLGASSLSTIIISCIDWLSIGLIFYIFLYFFYYYILVPTCFSPRLKRHHGTFLGEITLFTIIIYI